jgi:actin-like ATPase involved in cell morphogenesis
MGYELGVDLGTTYTAAATHRDGSVQIVELGNRTATIPSVIFLTENDEILTGEAANRRAVTEPGRVAREFKRRIGDPTPILLGGSPYSAESLSARLLEWVIGRVTEREGEAPGRIAVTHPANWGPYKLDLLHQAFRLANLEQVVTLTEPEAAAIHYATLERIEPGTTVGVFDLGGGTFDAAVLRKKAQGFDFLGEPEGIERLGGIDFDAAVFGFVRQAIGESLDQLDPNDPAVVAAVGRLRHDCVDAKEALSSDTDVTIPVALPGIHTEIRLTRGELEQMLRPSLADSIGAMQRAVRSADLGMDDIDMILLVGGSSRIPLVGQMVGAELGRRVAVDAHPKHSVALGAARAAAPTGVAHLASATLVAPVADLMAQTAQGLQAASPSTDLPAAAQPVASPPTAPPATSPPATSPPVSAPPATAPPATAPPAAAPPAAAAAFAASAGVDGGSDAPPDLATGPPQRADAGQPAEAVPQQPGPGGPSSGPVTSQPTEAPTSPSAASAAPSVPTSGQHAGPDPAATASPMSGGDTGQPLGFAAGAAAAGAGVAGAGIAGAGELGDHSGGSATGSPDPTGTGGTGDAPPLASFAGGGSGGGGKSKAPLLIGIGVVVALLVIGGIAAAQLGGGGEAETATGIADSEVGDGDNGDAAESTTTTGSSTTTTASTTSTSVSTTTTEAPFVCAGLCAHIDTDPVVQDNGELLIYWTAFNYEPDIGNFHAHFFYDIYEPEQVGSNAASFGATIGSWQLTDEIPFDTTGTNVSVADAPAGATQICVVAADSGHGVVNPENAECFDLP